MSTSEKRGRTVPFWAVVLVFWALFGFYLDTWLTPNSGSRACTALSLVDSGGWEIDALKDYTQDKSFVNGHYYGDKAPLSSVLLYFILKPLEVFSPSAHLKMSFDRALSLGAFFLAALPLAWFAAGMWFRSRNAFWVLAFCLGTFLNVYSGTFFGHVLAGGFTVLAYRSLFERDEPAWAGIWLGLGFMSEFPVGLAWPAFALPYFLSARDFKKTLLFGLAFLPSVLLIGAYNHSITGDAFTMVYSFEADPQFAGMRDQLGFRGPALDAVFGLLFSRFRGLFVYAPVLIFPLTVFLREWNRRLDRKKKNPSALARGFSPAPLYFFASLLLFSSYYMWGGGWAFGPRHLIPAVMLWMWIWSAQEAFKAPPPAWAWVLAAVGFGSAQAAKLTMKYMLPESYRAPITEYVWPELWAGKWNADAITTRWFGWSPAVSLLVFLALVALSAFWLSRSSPRSKA